MEMGGKFSPSWFKHQGANRGRQFVTSSSLVSPTQQTTIMSFGSVESSRGVRVDWYACECGSDTQCERRVASLQE